MELVIKNIGKKINNSWVVKDFSLTSGKGMIGLIGPNGAGKTTLMRMITTLIPPTSGTITWNGKDVTKFRDLFQKDLGYLPQEFGVFSELTGRQFLEYVGAMKEIPADRLNKRVHELLEVVNLESVADKRLGTYSGGMKQRIGIAQALINDPKLLIVDEPTVGLDPSERVHFRTLLAKLTTERLVILSTHIIGDIEAVASRIVILNEGTTLFDGKPEEIIKHAQGGVWTVTTDHQIASNLQISFQVSRLTSEGNKSTLRIVNKTKPHSLAKETTPTLEDAYLLLMKK